MTIRVARQNNRYYRAFHVPDKVTLTACADIMLVEKIGQKEQRYGLFVCPAPIA